MNRIAIAAVLGLVAAVPAAGARVYFAKGPQQPPCFAAAGGAYRIADSTAADYTVRIDNGAANPSLQMQIVDDPAIADFVLVDDSDGADACRAAPAIRSVRVDPAAQAPDVTIAVSHAPSDIKIYVKSASFTEQEAAALFAVVWKDGRRNVAGRRIAARNLDAPR